MNAVFSPTTPASVKAAQALFFVNAVIWLLFGAARLIRMTADGTGQTITAFGVFDFITLAIDLVLLGLLIVTRANYSRHR